ncbi:hypothetical protein GGI05_003433, partial [Coemansia sp. RSA 2603]
MTRVFDAVLLGILALGISTQHVCASPVLVGQEIERNIIFPGTSTNVTCLQDGHRVCVQNNVRSIFVCNNGKFVAARCPKSMECKFNGLTAHCVSSSSDIKSSENDGPQGNRRTANYVIKTGPPTKDNTSVVTLLGQKVVIRHHHRPKYVIHYDPPHTKTTPSPPPLPSPEYYHADPAPKYHDNEPNACSGEHCDDSNILYPDTYPD